VSVTDLQFPCAVTKLSTSLADMEVKNLQSGVEHQQLEFCRTTRFNNAELVPGVRDTAYLASSHIGIGSCFNKEFGKGDG
jgi:hypothetical protein